MEGAKKAPLVLRAGHFYFSKLFLGIVLVGKRTKLKEAQLKTEPWRVRSNA